MRSFYVYFVCTFLKFFRDVPHHLAPLRVEGPAAAVGIEVGGGGYAYGIYLNGSTNQDVCFNSVNITTPNTTSGMALYVTGTTTSMPRPTPALTIPSARPSLSWKVR